MSAEDLEYEPYEFKLDYYKASPLMENILGGNVISAAHAVIDAFSAGETSVDLSEFYLQEDFNERLTVALNSLFPPFVAFTDYMAGKCADSNGMLAWDLFIEKDKIAKKLSAFENIINDYMSRLRKADDDVVRAMLLYNCLTGFSSYDYLIDELDLKVKRTLRSIRCVFLRTTQ